MQGSRVARRMSRQGLRRAPMQRNRSSAAFTLVEMLVAVTVSLIIILAMVQVFQVVGGNVSTGRAIVEMQGQLRVVAIRLQQDLEGVTVPVRPWPDSVAAQGYFEYAEGPGRDWNPYDWTRTGLPFVTANPMLGDYDDYLMMTSRSTDAPFVGQLHLRPWDGSLPLPMESKVAEIHWWSMPEDENQNGVADEYERVRIHRRAWLIRPDLNQTVTDQSGSITVTNAVAVFPSGDPTTLRDGIVRWLDSNDLSVHVELDPSGAIKLVANSLADLTQRENRMAHWSVTVELPLALDLQSVDPASIATGTNSHPFPLLRDPTVVTHGSLFNTVNRSSTSVQQLTLGDSRTGRLREGQDIIMANGLAFDVQAYDPTAPLRGDALAANASTVALSPADMGWIAATANGHEALGIGAYVDLGYRPSDITLFFSQNPHVKSGLTLPTYCTWSLTYEKDGINQADWLRDPMNNPIVLVDEGTDGIDNDNQNGVDDAAERETSPPYPGPLRGVRIRIRMFEENTRQVRQIDIKSDFTPE